MKLIRIDGQEEFPDCVFVEDTAIAVKNRVFIANLSAPTRNGETKQVEALFESIKDKYKLKVGSVANKAEAFIDGGDCLFTGREFIVGLSTRTNQKGADELARFFDDIPVITCQVDKNLHLKSSLTMLDDDLIIVGSSQAAKSIVGQIERKSSFFNNYKFVEVSSDTAANVLSFNGTIVAPYAYKSEFDSVPELKADSRIVWVRSDEFEKIDGALTCRSMFFDEGN